jgi:hypothetical protein
VTPGRPGLLLDSTAVGHDAARVDTKLLAEQMMRLGWRAQALSTAALALCHSARETRAEIATQVRLSPFRRSARLARGGSREPITETLRRLCPFCNGEAVKGAGQQSVVKGTLKSLYRCQVCDVPFLWVRPVVESPRL